MELIRIFYACVTQNKPVCYVISGCQRPSAILMLNRDRRVPKSTAHTDTHTTR